MANYLFSEARLPGNVETLSLVILHQEVTLSQGQFNGYRVVCVVHYKEKTAIGHEFHVLHLRRHNDPSRVIVLRIERRPSTRILTSSSTVTDDSISPMDPNFDYTQFYHISTTYCSEERPLTVLGLCEVCAFIRQAAPIYSVVKAEHCYWFCAAFLIRLRMLDYCTGLTQRGPEYQRRGRCRGFKLISEDSIEGKLTARALNDPPTGFVPVPPLSAIKTDPLPPIPSTSTSIADRLRASSFASSLSSVVASSRISKATYPTPSSPLAPASISHSHAFIAVRPTPTQRFLAAPESAAVTTQPQYDFIPTSSHDVNDSLLLARNVGDLPSKSLSLSNHLGHGLVEWASSYDCVGHQKSVYSVCFSPDKRHIISGSEDCTVCIWDATSGRQVRSLKGHTNVVISVTVSPDGRRIASASFDNTVVRIWDLQTGTPITELLRGHASSVHSVAFSPDGRKIVSGSADKSMHIWDIETGAAVGEPLRGHSWEVRSVAWSPDGSRIVSGSWDEIIRVWDAQTGTPVGEPLRGHSNCQCVSSIAFSPDGSRVVSGSSDNTVRLWDIVSQRALGEPLHGHTESVYSVAFSPDGRWIASGSTDKSVRIWDSASSGGAGEVAKLDAGSEVWSATWSPAGDRIAAGCHDGKIRMWRKVAR